MRSNILQDLMMSIRSRFCNTSIYTRVDLIMNSMMTEYYLLIANGGEK